MIFFNINIVNFNRIIPSTNNFPLNNRANRITHKLSDSINNFFQLIFIIYFFHSIISFFHIHHFIIFPNKFSSTTSTIGGFFPIKEFPILSPFGISIPSRISNYTVNFTTCVIRFILSNYRKTNKRFVRIVA